LTHFASLMVTLVHLRAILKSDVSSRGFFSSSFYIYIFPLSISFSLEKCISIYADVLQLYICIIMEVVF